MKKAILSLFLMAQIASASSVEVVTCQISDVRGYAHSRLNCVGGFDAPKTTLQDMYKEGWRYVGSYTMKDYTYIVLERETKKQL